MDIEKVAVFPVPDWALNKKYIFIITSILINYNKQPFLSVCVNEKLASIIYLYTLKNDQCKIAQHQNSSKIQSEIS